MRRRSRRSSSSRIASRTSWSAILMSHPAARKSERKTGSERMAAAQWRFMSVLLLQMKAGSPGKPNSAWRDRLRPALTALWGPAQMPRGMPDSETVLLLRRWHAGDRGALDLLLERDLAWVRERVRRRLGPLLRAKAQTDDFVQDAVVEVLRYAPRFEVADRSQFRALLARIVENVLRDEHDRFSAKRRAIRRELPFPAGEEDRGPADDSSLRPSRLAEREEWESCIRFALALLDQEDREVVLL